MTSHDSEARQIWISKVAIMPDRCCTCGMYTDNRVTVKQLDYVQKTNAPDSCLSVILFLILHVALGPIGWLLSILFGMGELGEKKIVKKKFKLKIAQCRLCNGVAPPEIVELRSTDVPEFSFWVHPEFSRRFVAENAENENDVL
jgi:hypothetical protein